MQPLVVGAIGWNLLVLAVGVFLVSAGFRAWRFSRVIRNTATASPGSVAAGRAEVEGTVRPDGEPIETPFTGEACVCLDWTLEEYVDGEWVERAAETRIEPFYLEGETGEVLVCADTHPEIEDLPWEYDSVQFADEQAADVEQFLSEYRAGRGENPAATSQPATTTQPATTSESAEPQYRFIKRLIPLDQTLYVFGSLEPHHERGEIGFVTEPVTGRFVISTTAEKWTGTGYYTAGIIALAAGILFVLWGGSVVVGLSPELPWP